MQCPVCRFSGDFKLVEIYGEYKLFLCRNCDVVFSNPMKYPGLNWYIEFGHKEESGYMYDGKDLNKETIEVLMAKNIYWNHQQFLEDLPKVGSRLLDIGCGTCAFLSLVKNKYEVYGIDINHIYIDFAKEKLGLRNLSVISIEEFLKKLPQGKFDVITLFEVLEHMDNPLDFINSIKRALNPKGYLALSVPCRDRTFFKDEYHDKPPLHLTKWSKKALRQFLERNGFEIITHRVQNISDSVAQFISLNRIPFLKRLNLKIKSFIYKLPQDILCDRGSGLDYQKIVQSRIDLKPFFSVQGPVKRIKKIFTLPVIFLLKILCGKGVDQYVLARVKNGND